MELLQLDPNLKSLRSPVAYLYIENGTECTVDVYWIDYNSKLVRLTTLKVMIELMKLNISALIFL